MNRENFNLTSLKVQPRKGLEVKWSHTNETEIGKNYEDFSKKSEAIPHPDITDLIGKLKEYVATWYKLPEESADNLQIDRVMATYHKDNDKMSIQIFAKHMAEFGSNVQLTPIKTGKMAMHLGIYGFEDELQALLKDITSEAYEYVFNNKTAQLELAFDTEEEAQEAA